MVEDSAIKKAWRLSVDSRSNKEGMEAAVGW